MSILVVGTIGLDDIETPFGSVRGELGGSATHFSAAAGLYTPVNLVSIVGTDLAPERLDFLRQRGVDTRGVQVVEGRTFRWSGRYHFDMNSRDTLDTQLNVYANFVPSLPEDYRESQFVFLANMDPEQQRQVLEQVRAPVLTMMDTMDLWITTRREELDRTISMVDMVTMNDSEVRMFADTTSIVLGARRIVAMGPRAILVKKGENGAVMFTRDNQFFAAPAYPLEEIRDPTGAGDSFAGGFMGYLASSGGTEDDVFKRAVIHGSAIASFCVEDFGVQRLQTLTRGEVDRRYSEFHTFTQFEAL